MPGTTWSGRIGYIYPQSLHFYSVFVINEHLVFFFLSSKDVSVTTCCHIMCVIGEISAHLNEETKDRIVGE